MILRRFLIVIENAGRTSLPSRRGVTSRMRARSQQERVRSILPGTHYLRTRAGGTSSAGHGRACRHWPRKGRSRSKSRSLVINVMPRSRHEAARSASFARDGFDRTVFQPSRSASSANSRPLSRNAAAEGAKTRPRRSKGLNTAASSSRPCSRVRAPAANSCITTALKNVAGSARSRNADNPAANASFRNASTSTFVSSANFTRMAFRRRPRYHRRDGRLRCRE